MKPNYKLLESKLGNEFITTGYVAHLLCVAPRTVCKWVDTGKLKGFRYPNTNVSDKPQLEHRRIKMTDLIKFIEERGLPLPKRLEQLLTPKWQISYGLTLDQRDRLFGNLAFDCPFAFGVAVESYGFDRIKLAVIGESHGLSSAVQAATIVRRNNPSAKVFVLSEDKVDGDFTHVQSPVDWSKLLCDMSGI